MIMLQKPVKLLLFIQGDVCTKVLPIISIILVDIVPERRKIKQMPIPLNQYNDIGINQ